MKVHGIFVAFCPYRAEGKPAWVLVGTDIVRPCPTGSSDWSNNKTRNFIERKLSEHALSVGQVP